MWADDIVGAHESILILTVAQALQMGPLKCWQRATGQPEIELPWQQSQGAIALPPAPAAAAIELPVLRIRDAVGAKWPAVVDVA